MIPALTPLHRIVLRLHHVVWLGFLLLIISNAINAQTNVQGRMNQLVMVQGSVEVMRAGSGRWVSAVRDQVLRPGDRVRTGERSRAEIYLGNGMTIQKGELSETEIPPTKSSTFKKGLFKIFNRESSAGSEFGLPNSTTAAIRGTDFLVFVSEDGNSEVTVLDGEVSLKNANGEVLIGRNERGVAQPGRPPSKSAVIEAANDLIQWNLYYPAVVDMSEFGLNADERGTLRNSLAAYSSGDLVRAADLYPWDRANVSEGELLYRAALLLSAGQVDKATNIFQSTRNSSASRALTRLIEAVKFVTNAPPRSPTTASEWLAQSYYEQSQHRLAAARAAAHAATTNAPQFGFAWAHLAELEFSFGRRAEASAALERSLTLAPRNAQALTLKGFLLAARNKNSAALAQFDEALAVDSALGNAWLGRGLCSIHAGRADEGLRDLTVAASLEPQRSILRSYLGKAFANSGDFAHAEKELRLGIELDSRDPTPWLYSALLHLENHRVNEAVNELERSIRLNHNRALFRSRLLLDEDRAVRGANLARVYERAGLETVGLNEAARAVSYDQANYSAHQFLSDSFNLLRDPTRFNLRYETPWFGELLLANLLSPVGGTPLSQHISQQEYSRLFQRDRLGLSSDTVVRSDGEIRELASQYGNVGNTAWALDLDYQHNDGVRRNNRLDRTEWYTTVKQQLTPQDSVLLLFKYQDYESGDNFQYYDAKSRDPDYHFTETQHPIALAGYHREWSPGIHTLFLGGRLVNEQKLTDDQKPYLLLARGRNEVSVPGSATYDLNYRNEFEAWTAELSQLFQTEKHTFTLGGRFQDGELTGKNSLQPNDPNDTPYDIQVPFYGSVTEPADRVTGYGYWHWRVLDSLLLIGGMSYDRVTYPRLVRSAPVTRGHADRELSAPKAGVVWTPLDALTIRGAYTKSLGGVTLDQSYRLEPTHVAGFVQTFRTLLPISLTGPVSAQEFETAGAAAELKLPTRTYLTLQYERLSSEADNTRGVVITSANNMPGTPIQGGGTREKLDFVEHSAELTVAQLLGDEWSAGLRYRLARADLRARLPGLPLYAGADQRDWSDLHAGSVFALYNHPRGFFAHSDLTWYGQENRTRAFVPTDRDTDPLVGRLQTHARPSEHFPQWNLALGWRFPRQRGDVTVGVLNLTDENYHLSPVNFYNEMPHERVFYGRARFRF